MTDDNTFSLSADEAYALEVARALIRAGVPVFAAAPDPTEPLGYRLPKQWEKTVPSEVWLDKWQPGWALAAVGGHACDFLDVDPRNGGDVSAEQLQAADHWPRSFGQQGTPSGGTHYIISATGERKGTPLPGIDLQSGSPDGHGRGFVWIAPTVRISKVTGLPVAYRWEVEQDLAGLADWAGADDSAQHVVSLLRAKRAEPKVPVQRDPDDPFMTASSTGGERRFTQTQAQDFIRPYLMNLRAAPVGLIEETANDAAVALSHFVPEFWTANRAYALLTEALAFTAYDPERAGATWNASKFHLVLDGRRPSQDPWKAVRTAELDRTLFDPDAQPETVTAPSTAQEAMSLVDKLLGEFLTVDQMLARPAPRPLIMDVLDLDSEAWLIGPPGSRKSFVSLDMARCVATGTAWQGKRVRQGLVVYIVAEGVSGMSLRVKASVEHHGQMGDIRILPRPVQVRDAVAWEVLVAACKRLAPALVIIDTQARVTVGMEENSSTEMGHYVEAIRRIREATGACVLTIHHSGRNGTDARGSSAIDGAQGTELRVRVDGEKSQLRGSLLMDKQKDMAESEAGIALQFAVVDMGQDAETGRKLTSLVVVDADPFMTAAYIEEPWERELVRGQAQGQILRVLRDQGRTVGLTKAECLRSLMERFGPVQRTTYNTAWSRVLERVDADGEPLVVKTTGEKWSVVSLEVLGAVTEPGMSVPAE